MSWSSLALKDLLVPELGSYSDSDFLKLEHTALTSLCLSVSRELSFSSLFMLCTKTTFNLALALFVAGMALPGCEGEDQLAANNDKFQSVSKGKARRPNGPSTSTISISHGSTCGDHR